MQWGIAWLSAESVESIQREYGRRKTGRRPYGLDSVDPAVGERRGNGLEDDEEVRAVHRSEDVSVATELELYGILGKDEVEGRG